MITILQRILWKETNFKAGGLLLDNIGYNKSLVEIPKKFIAPNKLDFRDMCLSTSNQGSGSHCTGYATAGYIEVYNWKTKHYPEQVDGDMIYYESKKLDNYVGDGTWIKFSAQAALNLNLIDANIEYIEKCRNAVKFAIHEYSACIGAFSITNEWNHVSSKGIIPDYKDKSKLIGGHAVLICGYDLDGIYIQNSWSSTWGLYGFAFLSWDLFDRQFRYGLVFRKNT